MSRYIKSNLFAVLGISFIVILVSAGIFRAVEMHSNKRDITCTVTDTDRRLNGDKDGTGFKYLVRTEECGTIQIKGGFQWGTLFPGSEAGKLDNGTAYTFQVVGERNPWLLTYPTVKAISKAE